MSEEQPAPIAAVPTPGLVAPPPTTAPLPPATTSTKEDYDATTPRESSDANSPPGGSGQRKRKYEEATEEEKHALHNHHLNNPHLKQRELAEWFKATYGKSINQSTVSRNLKRFKASPPPAANNQRNSRPPPTSPTKQRKAGATKKIDLTKQHNLQPLTPSAVSLPPTPPPRDNRTSPIDSALYEFYLNYRKSHPEAPLDEVDRQIKITATKLIADIRPPPPPEKIDEPVVDDAWVANWKRAHGIPGPLRDNCYGAPDGDRTLSEETEPRSPVSTISSNGRRSSLELAHMNGQQAPPLPNGVQDPRLQEIENLKREIAKRERNIEHEQRKREAALRKLEQLEKPLVH